MFRIRLPTTLKKSPRARSQTPGSSSSSPLPSRLTPSRQSPLTHSEGAAQTATSPLTGVTGDGDGGRGGGDGRRGSNDDLEAGADVESGGRAGSVRYAGLRPEPKVDFRPFTKASAEKFDDKCAKIARDCGYPRKRKSNIEDESVLPGKYEPFPPRLYGHPLEEIDNFIYEEVSVSKDIYVCTLRV